MQLSDMYTQMTLYGFDDFEDAQKLMLLNESYLDLVTREPWPFLEKVVTITVPSGTTQITNNATLTVSGAVTNPSALTDVGSVFSFIDMTNFIVMVPERNDVIEKNYQITNSTSLPHTYYFVGDELFVYPATSGVTTYRLYYARIPSDLTSTTTEANILLPTRHHSIIVYGALVKAFLVNDDPQAAVFQNMFESKYQQMRNDLWMNQYDRTDRMQVMTDSYDWGY